jgi:hypothetical protein
MVRLFCKFCFELAARPACLEFRAAGNKISCCVRCRSLPQHGATSLAPLRAPLKKLHDICSCTMSIDPWKPGARSLSQHFRIVAATSAVIATGALWFGWRTVVGGKAPDKQAGK